MNTKLITNLLFCGLLLGQTISAADIWVAPNGSDLNDGTKEHPLASVEIAVRHARELRRLSDPSIAGGIHIILKGGTYQPVDAIQLRPEDAGTETSPTWIEAAPGEKPILSGGIQISGWKKASNLAGFPKAAQGKIWVADAPRNAGRLIEFRQLWVNNNKAVRASEYNEGKLQRILSVDKKNQYLYIPKPSFGSIKDAGQMEFFIHQWWAIATLRVKSVEVIGDSARVTFRQPESRIEFEHPWPAPFIDEKKNMGGNSAFYFMNAARFLDRPGEWFEDLATGKVYYWPRENEDLTKAEVTIPSLETLIQVEGTLEAPVSYINFKGITFEHTTWLRPSLSGHVPLQAGLYFYEAYPLKKPGTPDKAGLENQGWLGRQPAAVTVKAANNINFERCNFEHLGATGLDYIWATSNNNIEGCVFSDIGGTGFHAGYYGGANFEAHLPYDPEDSRELCQYLRFANNLVTNCTNDDWGCIGISVGYARNVTIEHNEVCDLNYMGICVGWGWTSTVNCMRNNRIIANHIHHFAKQMYDVSGIYTLSAQPKSEISRNYIHDLEKAPYAHDPNHWQYLYTDEGTSDIWVHDNWTEKDVFRQNCNGPGNKWENNGPTVSDSIKNEAGLEPKFRDLLKNK
ncbi:MAG: right-handed parallel beta-helix repeat-containing protein [Bacteroidota bacterium]|nr:right-handed parallel beta-helix repeat-containing protein [Bacteroidota bacterium]